MPPDKRKPEPRRPPVTERQLAATDYVAWKKATAALMIERGGRPAGVPEKEWRRLYLQGIEPREGAFQAQAFYENFIRRPILGVTGKRR